MPLAGCEPTIPVFKRAKTFHALDRASSVTGHWCLLALTYFLLSIYKYVCVCVYARVRECKIWLNAGLVYDLIATECLKLTIWPGWCTTRCDWFQLLTVQETQNDTGKIIFNHYKTLTYFCTIRGSEELLVHYLKFPSSVSCGSKLNELLSHRQTFFQDKWDVISYYLSSSALFLCCCCCCLSYTFQLESHHHWFTFFRNSQ
jgi:hypothetical protein